MYVLVGKAANRLEATSLLFPSRQAALDFMKERGAVPGKLSKTYKEKKRKKVL